MASEQWHAEYFEFLRIWDVTRGPADDAKHRFSVLEELTEEDARLIAAAPEMLEALQNAMKIVSLWNGRIVSEDHEQFEENKALYMMQEKFIEAIAKATEKARNQ